MMPRRAGPRAVGCVAMAARGRHGTTHFEGEQGLVSACGRSPSNQNVVPKP